MKNKILLAWTCVFLIGFIPAFLLFFFGPGDYSSLTHTLGQLSGLIGMTFFALTFILSTRMGLIENLFGGLDKVYRVHGVLGALSLILLLFHPIFLVLKFVPENLKLAAAYILPGGAISVDLGIFALLGMILLITVTLYFKIKYQKWKFSHEFFGFFFLLAVLHIFLIRSVIARDYIFEGYYIYAAVVSIIGVSGFFYSLIIRKKIKSKTYRITKILSHRNGTEIQLIPLIKGIIFRAGQFVFVTFPQISKEAHPFSIASSSKKEQLTIIIKSLGDFTSKLHLLKEGDLVNVEGAYGRFHYSSSFSQEVWVAGGIGITPFLGLAEDLKDHPSGKVDLYYSVKTSEEFIHLEELRAIAKSHPNFRIFPWITAQKGYINLAEIEKNSSGKDYYLCGPESLKSSIEIDLIKKGFPSEHIHHERFAFK